MQISDIAKGRLSDLRERSKKWPVEILAIEDNLVMQDSLKMLFERIFEKIDLHFLTEKEYQRIDAILDDGLYDVVVTAGQLGWSPHPIYKDNSMHLIPVVKKLSSKYFTIATSISKANLKLAEEYGADLVIDKADLSDLLHVFD